METFIVALRTWLAGAYNLETVEIAPGYHEWLAALLYRGININDSNYQRYGETPPKRSNGGTALTKQGAYSESVRNPIGFTNQQFDATLESGDKVDSRIHPTPWGSRPAAVAEVEEANVAIDEDVSMEDEVASTRALKITEGQFDGYQQGLGWILFDS